MTKKIFDWNSGRTGRIKTGTFFNLLDTYSWKLTSVFISICMSGISAQSAKPAPLYWLASRGDLDGAVLRNSWFTQLFVTMIKGVPVGPYVDIFYELEVRNNQ